MEVSFRVNSSLNKTTKSVESCANELTWTPWICEIMDAFREFLKSSTIHGLAYISSAQVISSLIKCSWCCPMPMLFLSTCQKKIPAHILLTFQYPISQATYNLSQHRWLSQESWTSEFYDCSTHFTLLPANKNQPFLVSDLRGSAFPASVYSLEPQMFR